MRILFSIIMFALASSAAQGQVAQILGGMGGGEAPQMSGDYLAPRKPVSLTVETVAFTRSLEPGSILVRTSERKLYYVLPGQQALAFPVGVGREGFAWSGTNTVTKKLEWPDWRPPREMIKREAERGHFIPEFVKGGKMNPLGAAAIYIGDTQYRIHGTSAPWSIGRAVSSGCIRMLNEHVQQLYGLTQIGATVLVE